MQNAGKAKAEPHEEVPLTCAFRCPPLSLTAIIDTVDLLLLALSGSFASGRRGFPQPPLLSTTRIAAAPPRAREATATREALPLE